MHFLFKTSGKTRKIFECQVNLLSKSAFIIVKLVEKSILLKAIGNNFFPILFINTIGLVHSLIFFSILNENSHQLITMGSQAYFQYTKRFISLPSDWFFEFSFVLNTIH